MLHRELKWGILANIIGLVINRRSGRFNDMSSNYIFVVRMDVQHDKEELFNEVYDSEHVPELKKVKGVFNIGRYWTALRSEPKYLAIYEIDNPNIRETAEWKKYVEIGRWSKEVRPYTMNRYHAIYAWVGGNPGLKWDTKYLFLAMMDVEEHKEALFNELYEAEHIPQLMSVPGVTNVTRYKTSAEGHPQYLAIYEIEQPDVPTSEAFWKEADKGRWISEVRPYTYNKHLSVYERIKQ